MDMCNHQSFDAIKREFDLLLVPSLGVAPLEQPTVDQKAAIGSYNQLMARTSNPLIGSMMYNVHCCIAPESREIATVTLLQ
jgi:hypothetical protein